MYLLSMAISMAESTSVTSRLLAARRNTKTMERHRAGAIYERNLLIAALARVWPSHLSETKKREAHRSTDVNRKWVVCIHSPAGQLAWHLTNEEATSELFKWLEKRENDWDGHKAAEKPERLLQVILGHVGSIEVG